MTVGSAPANGAAREQFAITARRTVPAVEPPARQRGDENFRRGVHDATRRNVPAKRTAVCGMGDILAAQQRAGKVITL